MTGCEGHVLNKADSCFQTFMPPPPTICYQVSQDYLFALVGLSQAKNNNFMFPDMAKSHSSSCIRNFYCISSNN